MFNNYSFDTEYPCSPVTSSKGFTKLMYLVINQKVILKEDLEKLEINEKNEKGWIALMIAYIINFTKYISLIINQKVILKEDLEKLKSEINEKNEEGWTALMIACRNSNTKSSVETVRLLLDRGAKIDMQDNNGWTALMMAAKNSHTDSNIETVRLLLVIY